ncbi:hypothetical protein pb186bvf_010163 [Paramecium bursaria]
MIRSGLNILRRSHFTYRPIMKFSSDHEPPKGFEKFQRKKQESKNTEKKPEQKITPEEEAPPQQAAQQEEQKLKKEQPQEPPQEFEKPKKEKIKFTYDPKSFNLNQETPKPPHEEPEKAPESDQEEDQPKKEKKKSFQETINQNYDQFKKFYEDPKNKKYFGSVAAILGLGVGALFLIQEEEITYNEFLYQYLETSRISSIYVDKSKSNHKISAQILLKTGDSKRLVLGNVDHFLENLEKFQNERGISKDQFIPIQFRDVSDMGTVMENMTSVMNLAMNFIFIGSIIYFYRSTKGMMGKGGPGGENNPLNFGKFNAKQFGFEQSVKVKFKDVAGLDEAKTEVKEFVDFLKKPRKYKEMGAKIPRGALLAGPPGTGKTMIAKACAGEAGVPFFYVSGSDFVEMFVGVGASRVRDLFKQAKAKAPSIVFIDEIDAVGRKRENRVGGNDERDNTLNQLLVEMDGFGTDSNVIVLAATNRKELLDTALTRPGRFDRTIDITLPDIEGRKQIFLVHLAPIKLDPSKAIEEYAKRLATLTPGFSGAEISNLCNEAAIMAARANKLFVDSHDFEMASERVMAGLEKKKMISEEERRVVAYHESGHAVVSWFLEGGHPLLKLTIIPRSKGSLGYAQYLPNESSLETKSELLDRICCILGGRVSEETFFGEVTTGAYDDLKKAYEVAHNIVTKFGMSENIGYVGYQETEFSKPYSDSTNKKIDDEIKAIIDECTRRTRELVKSRKDDIKNLSEKLLEKETLDLQKIVEVLGERPFKPKSNYKAYLETKQMDKAEDDAKNEPKIEPKEV